MAELRAGDGFDALLGIIKINYSHQRKGFWGFGVLGLCASQFSFIGGVYTLAAAHYEDYAI